MAKLIIENKSNLHGLNISDKNHRAAWHQFANNFVDKMPELSSVVHKHLGTTPKDKILTAYDKESGEGVSDRLDQHLQKHITGNFNVSSSNSHQYFVGSHGNIEGHKFVYGGFGSSGQSALIYPQFHEKDREFWISHFKKHNFHNDNEIS